MPATRYRAAKTSAAVLVRFVVVTAFLLLFALLLALAAAQPILGLLAVVAFVYALLRKKTVGEASRTHGSARLATNPEMKHAGMLDGEDGLVIARTIGGTGETVSLATAIQALLTWPLSKSVEAVDLLRQVYSKEVTNSIIRVNKFTHMLICAGTGAGKGVGFVLPNLIVQRKDSFVLLDIKGENAQVGTHRAKFSRVVCFDPWGITGRESACFNPMDLLDPEDRDYWDDCTTLATVMVERNEREPHFSDMASMMITLFMAYIGVMFKKGDPKRSISTVAQLLSGQSRFQKSLEAMAKCTAMGGLIAHKAAEASSSGEKERGSILSTTARTLSAFSSPAVAEHLSKSNFDYLELVEGDKPVSLFWALPATKVESHKNLAKLWIQCLILRLMKQTPSEKSRKVIMILDEIAQLGAMPSMEIPLTLGRGWNLRIALIVQSLQQLDRIFPDGADTVQNNTNVQMFFGISDVNTAEQISKKIGQETVSSYSYQEGDNSSSGMTYSSNDTSSSITAGSSTSLTAAEQGRDLLQPAEIVRLPKDMVIAFTDDVQYPILAQRLTHYKDPEFADKLNSTGSQSPSPKAKSKSKSPSTLAVIGRRMLGLMCIALALLGIWGVAFYDPKPQPTAPPPPQTPEVPVPAGDKQQNVIPQPRFGFNERTNT